jgi:hypothetical protein
MWRVIHDFGIDASTFQLIHDHSEKLLALSNSIQSWNNSSYGNCLRIVNSETMNILRDYWTQYSNANNSAAAFVQEYTTAIKKVYERHYENVKPLDTLMAAAKTYWENGGTLRAVSQSHCNPLFAYSDASGSRFSIHHETSPLAGFHLINAQYKLIPKSPLYLNNLSHNGLGIAMQAAKMEFQR